MAFNGDRFCAGGAALVVAALCVGGGSFVVNVGGASVGGAWGFCGGFKWFDLFLWL